MDWNSQSTFLVLENKVSKFKIKHEFFKKKIKVI